MKAITQYLYVVTESDEFCKIGLAAVPHKRLRYLQIGSPRVLRLVFAEQLEFAWPPETVERHAHLALADRHTHGEWFRCSAADAILAVKNAVEWARERQLLLNSGEIRIFPHLPSLQYGDERPRTAICDVPELDTFRVGKKPFCIRGHPLSGDNLLVHRGGFRQCYACIGIRKRAWRLRKKNERASRSRLDQAA